MLRAPGRVVCAHCKREPARDDCATCGMARCDGCSQPCPRPVVREIRLGMGRRLRDIDPTGRYGLVGTLLGRRKIYDLDEGAFTTSDAVPRDSMVLPDGGTIGARVFSEDDYSYASTSCGRRG